MARRPVTTTFEDRTNGAKNPVRVWRFNALAAGCSAGVRLPLATEEDHHRALDPKDVERFPPGHKLHDLMTPLMADGRLVEFFDGADHQVDEHGKIYLWSNHGAEFFVRCPSKALSVKLGVQSARMLCSECDVVKERNRVTGTKEVCNHAGEFWGFFGLEKIIVDATSEVAAADIHLSTAAMRDFNAKLKDKDMRAVAAEKKAAEKEAEAEKTRKELAVLRKQLEDERTASAKALAKSK